MFCFPRFSHRGCVAHTYWDVRAPQESPSPQNGWRRKAGWGGALLPLPFLLFRSTQVDRKPHRLLGLPPRLALTGRGPLPSLLLRGSTPGTPLPSLASSKFRAGRASPQRLPSLCVSEPRPLAQVSPEPAGPHACTTDPLPSSRVPTIKGYKKVLPLWDGGGILLPNTPAPQHWPPGWLHQTLPSEGPHPRAAILPFVI